MNCFMCKHFDIEADNEYGAIFIYAICAVRDWDDIDCSRSFHFDDMKDLRNKLKDVKCKGEK